MFRVVPIEKTAAPSGATSITDTDKRKKAKEQVNVREINIGSATLGGNKQSQNRCGNCEGCRAPNCGICESCRIRVGGHKPRCEMRICQAPPIPTSQQQQQQSQPQTQQQNVVPAPLQAPNRHKRKEKQPKERSRKRKRSLSPEVFMNPDLEGVRQCYGPRCKNNARPQSKYCSDVCGINLATNRIFQVCFRRRIVFRGIDIRKET